MFTQIIKYISDRKEKREKKNLEKNVDIQRTDCRFLNLQIKKFISTYTSVQAIDLPDTEKIYPSFAKMVFDMVKNMEIRKDTSFKGTKYEYENFNEICELTNNVYNLKLERRDNYKFLNELKNEFIKYEKYLCLEKKRI
ncbi:MAG: hypothetical protein HRU03_07305 [Nanoarchaeales archaeon]|nr:hypothetical protein [Nanoarchaeales archaeon]